MARDSGEHPAYHYLRIVAGHQAMPEPEKRATIAGFVYFIRAGKTNSVKIGWALDPERRLDALQTGSPHQLHLLAFIPGTPADERQWHAKFRSDRIRGEWFKMTAAVRSAINRVGIEGGTLYFHQSVMVRGAR